MNTLLADNVLELQNINNVVIRNKRIRSDSEISVERQGIKDINNTEEKRYKEYKKNNDVLEKLKIEDIKLILDYYIKKYDYFKYYSKKNKIKLKKSGNKKELLNNIKLWYLLNIKIEKIQRIFRGYLIRKMIKLRGPGLIHRNICVNETDFCTLEPLIDIDNKDFFSYKDEISGCIFGFDISSLWTMYKK
jgi:hypothetical protein